MKELTVNIIQQEDTIEGTFVISLNQVSHPRGNYVGFITFLKDLTNHIYKEIDRELYQEDIDINILIYNNIMCDQFRYTFCWLIPL